MDAETRQLNADPMAEIGEDLPCLEQDAAHIVTKEPRQPRQPPPFCELLFDV